MAILTVHAAGWIRINQLGYLPHATKVAVLISQEKIEVTQFELVDAYTGKTAYCSTATRNMGANGQMAATCRLDFSACSSSSGAFCFTSMSSNAWVN